jgi:hypothetical protein
MRRIFILQASGAKLPSDLLGLTCIRYSSTTPAEIKVIDQKLRKAIDNLGESASDEEENGQREWVLQIVKHRSLKEKLTGKEKLTPTDEFVQLLLSTRRAEPSFVGIYVD